MSDAPTADDATVYGWLDRANAAMGTLTPRVARVAVRYGPLPPPTPATPDDPVLSLQGQVATLSRQVVALAAQLETTRPNAEAVSRVMLAAGEVEGALFALSGAVDALVRQVRLLAAMPREVQP